jgi:hypothetical protein
MATGGDDQYRKRGVVSQIAITVFVGIPSTLALVAAMGAYCTFQFFKYLLVAKPAVTTGSAAAGAEHRFSESLGSLAEIHGPAIIPACSATAGEDADTASPDPVRQALSLPNEKSG